MQSGYHVCATPPTVYADSFETCFGHGLKMCMWFGYNPQISFVTFFQTLLLSTSLDSR